jgi:N-acetylmuramoyl-L-alanine amidase
MKMFRYSIIIFLICMTGCASAPVKDTFSIKGPRYSIEGCTYIGLASIVNAYDLDLAWDPVGRRLTLSMGDNNRVGFALGSRVALVDSVPYRLKKPVVMRKGVILIPGYFSESVLAGLFTKKQVSPCPISEQPHVLLPYHAVKMIVLDPGHGGKDPGAVAKNGLKEKDIVLDISKRIKRYLERESIEVRLTRCDDTFISLWKRADTANKCGADFFISIHANAAHSSYARGFEVFYLSEAVDDNARAIAAVENASLRYEDSSFGNVRPSSSLEATLWDIEYSENRRESIELAKSITDAAGSRLGLKNRGEKGANFYVLKGAKMPSVLVEVGFISNDYEARLLRDPSYRQDIAKSVAYGVINYKNEYEAAEGFTRRR